MAVLERPLEEPLGLWVRIDWARVDCRLEGQGRPGSRLWVPAGWCSIVSSPRNAQSTVRPCNRSPHHPRPQSAQVLRHLIRPPMQPRLRAPQPSLPKTSTLTRAPNTRLSFSSEFRFPAQTKPSKSHGFTKMVSCRQSDAQLKRHAYSRVYVVAATLVAGANRH